MTYFEKLKDPRWQKKRLQIFERDKWACLCCDRKDETLCVHHLVYSAKEPWDEPDENLETLCEDCHSFREDFNKLGARSVTPTRFCYALIRFSCCFYPALPVGAERENPYSAFAKFLTFINPIKAGASAEELERIEGGK